MSDLAVLRAILYGDTVSPPALTPVLTPALVDRLRADHILGQLPDGALEQPVICDLVQSARVRAGHDRRVMLFEIDRVERALRGTDITPLILKGGAYAVLDHPVGQHRRTSDLDILVPENQLAAVEQALKQAYFEPHPDARDDYDQAYYRQQMHELPPLVHKFRRTTIDVHHRLTPPDARVTIDTQAVIDAALTLPGRRVMVPCQEDLIIHAAIHAFYDGTLEHPLRHLTDLARLLGAYGIERGNLAYLRERAGVLGCRQAFADSLVAVAPWVGIQREAYGLGRGGMLKPLLAWQMRGGVLAHLSKAIAYLRGHYLRMPLVPLARHLGTKAMRPAANALSQLRQSVLQRS